MGACESTSAKVVCKYAADMSDREISSRAKKIVNSMRKRIPRVDDNDIVNFLRDFELNDMLRQNESNVERLLAEVITQFRTKDMIIVTWRDTTFPVDMPVNKKPAIFEILIYKRDLSRSWL